MLRSSESQNDEREAEFIFSCQKLRFHAVKLLCCLSKWAQWLAQPLLLPFGKRRREQKGETFRFFCLRLPLSFHLCLRLCVLTSTRLNGTLFLSALSLPLSFVPLLLPLPVQVMFLKPSQPQTRHMAYCWILLNCLYSFLANSLEDFCFSY